MGPLAVLLLLAPGAAALPASYATADEAARILGAAIGKPDLKYVQLPYEETRRAMTSKGLTGGYADAMNELSRHMNEAMIQGTEPRSAVNTTETTLERFAREVFAPACEAAAGALR